MKLKLVATNNLKALDIDLKLNKPTSENISNVMKTISRYVTNSSGDLELEVKGSKRERDKVISIPDEAVIERIDLESNADRRKVSIRIRSDKQETTFVPMSEDDQVKGIIVDGENIFEDESLPRVLMRSNYILVIKRSDLEKSKETREKRNTAELESFQLRREKRRERDISRFQMLMDTFQQNVEKYKNLVKEIENIGSDTEKPRGLIAKDLIQLKKNNLFFTTRYPEDDGEYYQILDDYMNFPLSQPNDEDSSRKIKLIGFKLTKGKITGEVFRSEFEVNAGKETEVYVWNPPKQTQEQPEFEIEPFIPELNFKDLLRKDSVFPENIFPTYASRSLNSVVEVLARSWDGMTDAVNKLKNIGFDPTEYLERYQEALRKGKRISPDMSYVDKSGYEVDLGKYFDKLAEMPAEVPKVVRDKYKEIFDYITEASKELSQKAKEALENDDFEQVIKLSSIIKNYGPKAFNDTNEKYLQLDYHERSSSAYNKPQVYVDRFKIFKEQFDEKVSDMLND
jgi:hypothetical protein